MFSSEEIAKLDLILGDWLEDELFKRWPIEKLSWKSYILGWLN